MSDQSIVVENHEQNLRLDKLLSLRFPELSRTYLQWLIAEGHVSVNGTVVKKSAKPELADEIDVDFVPTNELSLEPENIPLDVLYEDEHLLAINKPAGLVVHPGPGNWKGTFVNALLYHCKTLEHNDALRPGIVHRLDKETSGVLLAAKTSQAHAKLTQAFCERKIQKKYLAICFGTPHLQTIEAPIARHPTQRKLMTVAEEGGKFARTHVRLLATNGVLSVVEVDLETGRTHQIRVHLKHIGHSLVGDDVYGKKLPGVERPMLHAQSIAFIHPITLESLVINAALPQDIELLVQKITIG